MPQQVITIPIDARTPEKAPAVFLAILAYPRRIDVDKRSMFILALRAEYFALLGLDFERNMEPRAIEPALLLLEREYPKMLSKSYKAGFQLILKYRLIAARMAATVLHYNAAGERLSVHKVAEHVAESLADGDGGNPSNVLGRQWGTSRPVLHLALALREVIGHRFRLDTEHGDYQDYMGPDEYQLYELLAQPEWIEPAVSDAESIRRYLVSLPLFRRINENNTVKVETGLVSSSSRLAEIT